MGMSLTSRDEKIIWAVYKHRYLSCEHIKQLFFVGKSDTAVQTRLRRLWSNHFLDRYYRPWSYDGTKKSCWRVSAPFYTLAEVGAEVIWDNSTLDWDEIPKTPQQNAMGFHTLQHHLAVTDLLVAIEAACQHRGDVNVTLVERESAMQSVAAKLWQKKGRPGDWIVSDGAFTLAYPQTGQEWTYQVELVKASVRGGNKTLVEKMRRYARLHHQGYFDKVFGHKQVRAILFCTTTDQRARGFRDMAAQLPHGRGLFWFTPYQQNNADGLPITTFYPDTVLKPIWHGADGQTHSLIPPGASSCKDEKTPG